MATLTIRRLGAALVLLAAGRLDAQATRDADARVPARPVPAGELRVRPRNTRREGIGVVIERRGHGTASVSLDAYMPGVAVDSVRLVAASRRGRTTYLLLDVMGPSRRTATGSGYCGAGTERTLVAVELVARSATSMRARRVGSALFESCLYSINQGEPEIGYAVAPDSVWGEWIPYERTAAERLRVASRPMRYLLAHPERGLHAAEGAPQAPPR